MNMSPVFINHSYGHWGFQYPDGNYTFMYKLLYEKKADVMFGFLYGNSTYSKDFDSSHCHLLDPSVWWVPIALPVPQWKNIILIFDKTIWFSIIIIIPVISFCSWFIERARGVRKSNLITCILKSLNVLLQGSVEQPLSFKNRFLFIIWVMASLLLFTAYQCQLVSILSKPAYDDQIRNLEQLVSSDLKIGFYPTVAEGFNESHNEIHKKILKSYISCSLTNECINRTAYKRDFATFKNQRSGLYLIPKYFSFSNGRPMLFKFEEFGILSIIRFMTIKNWPLLDRFNIILMRLQTNGLITKWDRDIKHLDYYKFSQGQNLVTLNMNHLLSAFYVLFFGLAVACLVFFTELLCTNTRYCTR